MTDSMSALDELSGKLDYLLARESIRELRSRYSLHAGQGDWRGIADLFADDGVFDTVRPNGERMLWHGRAVIFENLQARNVSVLPMISNEIIEIDGDTAVGSCTMMTPTSPDPSSRGFMGQYHDEMRREQGKWLFTLRRFEVLSGSF